MNELLPCPFCGGGPQIYAGFTTDLVCCSRCSLADLTREDWNTRVDHIVDANKKGYTEKQVKAIALTFFDAFPKHDSLHMESIFDAWFEKYGSKL